MTGHTPWRDIRHKRDRRCLDKSLTNETCQLPYGHKGNHQDRSGNIRWGSGPEYGDFSKSPGYSSDVGDEHVERAPDPSPSPTQPPPKPADARRSVEPPAYRYRPNLERLSRRSFVEEGDRKIVEGMLRHTRPIVDQIRDPLVEKIIFPSEVDKVDHLYPYQTEAVEQIEEAVDLLNGIIKTQHTKLSELTDFMAIQHEMYGDPAKLQERAENAEIELGRLYEVNRNLEQLLDETRQQLSACNVDLHDSKQHQLGLMCAEQTDKLEAIRKRISEVKHGDGYWLALDIEDILDGTSE